MVELTTDKSDGGDFELIDENELVNVRVQDVGIHTFTWEKEEVEKLRWEFLITDDGPWHGKVIWGDTSTTFNPHPNCKAYSWVTAITGKRYEQGETLDTDDLIGLPCRIMIGHKTDRQDRTWMRAKEVLPARSATRGTAPSEAPF